MNQELLSFIQSLFGEGLLILGDKTPNADTVKNSIQELVNSVTSFRSTVESQAQEINSYKDEINNLKAQVESMKKDSEIAKMYEKEVRDSTMASYKKLMGEDNLDSAIVNLLETTNVETLKALKKTYDAQLEDKFPLHCQECGSKNVTRSSSITPKNEDEDNNSFSDLDSDFENIIKEKNK